MGDVHVHLHDCILKDDDTHRRNPFACFLVGQYLYRHYVLKWVIKPRRFQKQEVYSISQMCPVTEVSDTVTGVDVSAGRLSMPLLHFIAVLYAGASAPLHPICWGISPRPIPFSMCESAQGSLHSRHECVTRHTACP